MADNSNESFPMLFVRDGAVLASSRTVAEAFGKRHDHTINAIDNLLISLTPENSGMLFREVLTEHPTVPGRMIRSFEMTRDGFTLLAMGFTGERACIQYRPSAGRRKWRSCQSPVSTHSSSAAATP